MAHADDDPDAVGLDEATEPATGVAFWVLTPGRRALHWALIAATLALVAAVLVSVGPEPTVIGLIPAVGFVGCALGYVIAQLRAVVGVWLDPTDGSLTLFRAAGGTIRTHPTRVRRIDHGRIDAYYRSPTAHYLPTRIVTDDGTGTLSPFFHAPEDVTDAIAARNPDAHIDL